MPDWRSMLRTVPFGRSRFGCGTVTSPGRSGPSKHVSAVHGCVSYTLIKRRATHEYTRSAALLSIASLGASVPREGPTGARSLQWAHR